MVIFRQFEYFSIEKCIENKKNFIKNGFRYIFYVVLLHKNTRTDVLNNYNQRIILVLILFISILIDYGIDI